MACNLADPNELTWLLQGNDLMHRDGVLDMVRSRIDPVYASVVERCFALDERTAGRSLTVDDLTYLEKVILKPWVQITV